MKKNKLRDKYFGYNENIQLLNKNEYIDYIEWLENKIFELLKDLNEVK